MKFEWKPGVGIDYAALERMKQHFSKPKVPPYKAWFMGKPAYWDGWMGLWLVFMELSQPARH